MESLPTPDPLSKRTHFKAFRIFSNTGDLTSKARRYSPNSDMQKHQEDMTGPSFQSAISPVVRWIQLFGIMPLKGLQPQAQEQDIHFKWLSMPVFACFAFLTWDGVVMFAYVRHLPSIGGLKVSTVTTLIFHGMGFLSYLIFLHLARKWGGIATKWSGMERRFLQGPLVSDSSKRLKRNIGRIAAVIAVLSIAEHSLFVISMIFSIYSKHVECKISDDFLEYFFEERFPYIVQFWPSMIALVFTQMLSFIGTVIWNFVDLFVILVSIGIRMRFQQLYDHMKSELKLPQQHLPGSFFESCRLDYIQICELLSFVDGNIAILVFLSCTNNLYFICNQLLNVFTPQRYLIDYVYFWYSLLYLIGRTLFLFDTASQIHETSRKPLLLLKNIPQKDWSDEIDRFLFQLNTETIAMTAMGFFNFTRELILTMLGAILTFELVMLQLSVSQSLPTLCPVELTGRMNVTHP